MERKSRKTGRETTRQGRKKIPKKREERGTSPQGNAYDADESDPEDSPGYQQVCTQVGFISTPGAIFGILYVSITY